jgi:Ca2+-binding RTX toxin-like protein
MMSAFRRWLKQCRVRTARRRTNRPKYRMPLGFELAEDRRMLAAGLGFDALAGLVTINGTSGADSARIALVDRRILITLDTSGLDFSRSFSASQVKRIVFNGGNGDDRCTNTTAITATLYGGAGNDTLIGGSGVDQIDGGEGDDRLVGGLGNDRLLGGDGNDTLTGSDGNDRLDGGLGNDLLEGGAGNDWLVGGKGNDTYRFDADVALGVDTLDESAGGVDTLHFGATTTKRVTAQLGIAWEQTINENLKLTLAKDNAFENVIGGAWANTIIGNVLNNRLIGGNGDDFIAGHGGNDYLDGGAGNDDLSGGAGYDSMIGGAGSDKLTAGAYELDRVPGFTSVDRLEFMEQDTVRKYVADASGQIYTLHADYGLRMPYGNALATLFATSDFTTLADGTLFRLDTSGRLTKIGSTEVELGKNITKYSVTSTGLCVAIDRLGRLWVNGAEKTSAISDYRLLNDGTLYTLSNAGILAKEHAGTWTQLGSRIAKFAVSLAGGWQALDRDGWLWVNGVRKQSAVRDIAMTADGTSYRLDASGNLTKTPPGTSGLAPSVLGAQVARFAVTGKGDCYALDREGWLSRNGQRIWQEVRDFALAQDGGLYLLDSTGELWAQFSNGEGSSRLGVGVVKFGVSALGHYAALDREGNLWLDGIKQEGSVRDFQLLADGTLHRLYTSGKFTRTPPTGLETTWSTGVTKFAVSDLGRCVALGADGSVWDQGTKLAGVTARDIGMSGDGMLFVMETNGALSRANAGFPWAWRQQLGNFSKFAVTAEGRCLALDGAGKLWDLARAEEWYFTGSRILWENTRDFTVFKDGGMYLLRADGYLMEEIPTGWQTIDYNVSAWQVVSDHRVVTLHTDGSLWVCRQFEKSLLGRDVASFTSTNGEVWATKLNGNVEVTSISGDLGGYLRRAVDRIGSQSGGTPARGVWGVVGNTTSRDSLVTRYGNREAPTSILGSVVKVHGGMHGSGTVLDYGGNRFVLTAAHVIENPATGAEVGAGSITVNGQAVRQVFGRRSFGGRDLALLQMESALSGVQGAVLPQGDPWKGIELLVAGYGLDNSGDVGNLSFGFARYEQVGFDPADYVPDNHASTAGVGTHLINTVQQDEASSARGDSGGPDFLVRHRQIGGVWTWVPELVGVHSFGDADRTGSVQVTTEVVDTIRRLVGEPTLKLRFGVRVFANGDDGISGDGEWWYNLVVNNVAVKWDAFMSTRDGEDLLVAEYAMARGETGSLRVSFWGYEEDDGFFNGDDEIIPRLDATVGLPQLTVAYDSWISLGRRDGDVAYELFASARWSW